MLNIAEAWVPVNNLKMFLSTKTHANTKSKFRPRKLNSEFLLDFSTSQKKILEWRRGELEGLGGGCNEGRAKGRGLDPSKIR